MASTTRTKPKAATNSRPTAEQLEQRVAALERDVADLKRSMAGGGNGAAVDRTKDWRRTIGMFTGDEVMQQVFEEAMKLREADREKARRHWRAVDARRAAKAKQAKQAKQGKQAGQAKP